MSFSSKGDDIYLKGVARIAGTVSALTQQAAEGASYKMW